MLKYRTDPYSGITELPIHFDPAGSWFVVFRKSPAAAEPVFLGGRKLLEISGPWKVFFPPDRQAPESITLPELVSWTEDADEGVKYFSGTATYRKTFLLDEIPGSLPLLLDLGRVENLAEVTLNGGNLGVLWKPPFRVDISDAVREGQNRLEIKVTNLWTNRLIGDAKLHPDPELDYSPNRPGWSAAGPLATLPDWVRNGGRSPVGRTSFVLWGFYGGDEPLMESGLLGPVKIMTQR